MKQLILITIATIFTTTLLGQYQIETCNFIVKDGKYIKSEFMNISNCSIEKFDSDSLLIERPSNIIPSNGAKTTYEYNDKKQIIAEHHFNTEGEVTSTSTYEYWKGLITNIEKSSRTNEDGISIDHREEYGYNLKTGELIIKIWSTNISGIEYIFNYKTTYEGKLKKVVEHRNNFGRDAGTVITYYDEDGLEIKKITISGEDLLKSKPTGVKSEIKFEYEFDENGFWTKKKSYENGVLIGEQRRTIIK